MSTNSTQNFRDNLRERVMIRMSIEKGVLPMPYKLKEKSDENIDRMWDALWRAFMSGTITTSTTYWYDQVNRPSRFNKFLKAASDEGWINSLVLPNRHWGEISLNKSKLLEFVPNDTLIKIRRFSNFKKYSLSKNTNIEPDNNTRQNGKVSDTGISRPGFAKCGSAEFKYDTDVMFKYRDAIILNVNKSMIKVHEKHEDIEIDGADYMSISTEIVDKHIYVEDTYTLGANYNDSRGRAISSALRKVFNPIGFKDARALLVAPKVAIPKDTTDMEKSIYLFIAELIGVKTTVNVERKIKKGRTAYENKQFHDLDLSLESDRKDLHENIWLERIYRDLDLMFAGKLKHWNVPVELDASASMLGITGVLLNDKDLMSITNILGKRINDPWKIDGLTRPQVKFSATPRLYGSSQTSEALWTKNKVDFTREQSIIMDHEIHVGRYENANDLKDMIIENVQPKPTMKVKVWNDEFTIECNRFKVVKTYTKRYPLFSSDTNQVEAIAHTLTHKVPDLKQFKRFFQTLLIHGIDSQIADHVSYLLDWCLSIHDAWIVNPIEATKCRRLYAERIENLHANRLEVLNNYFKSINLNKKALKDWERIKTQINEFKGDFKCNHIHLK